MRGSIGEGVVQGFRIPHENHTARGFLSNTGPDPWKITKLRVPSQHLFLGHYRPASEQMIAHFY